MSNELLDFSSGGIFTFATSASEEKRTLLKHECEKIRDCAKDVLASFSVLGYRLKELRDSRLWCSVLDENGERYLADESFYDFTARFFGFSRTKTQNMISVAQFVKMDGETVTFIDEQYAGYKTSQLIELSSVSDYERRYYSPSMTVAEIRLLKKYLKYRVIGSCTPEEALAKAKAHYDQEERQKKETALLKQEPLVSDMDYNTETIFLRSFFSSFPDDLQAKFIIYRRALLKPTTEELAEVLERECRHGNAHRLTDDKKGSFNALWGTFGAQVQIVHKDYKENVVALSWRDVARRISYLVSIDGYMTEEEKEEATRIGEPVKRLSEETVVLPSEDVQESRCSDIVEVKNYPLKSRIERRFWLSDFKNWESVKDARTVCLCAISAYFYSIESANLTVFAYEYQTVPRGGDGIETKVRYMIDIGEEGSFVDVSADGIERYVAKLEVVK